MYSKLAGKTVTTKRRQGFYTSFPKIPWSKQEDQSQFNIVAVNYSDSSEDVRNFATEFGLTMPLVMGGQGQDSVSTQYGVMAYPTNYIVDSNGIVVAQFVGFDENGIKKTLSRYGVSF